MMKHILLTIHLCLTLVVTGAAMSCGTCSAQTITTLDWNVLRIDTMLPHYSEVVPLASDFAQYEFSVDVQYATWQRLTAAEERLARLSLDELADTLIVNTHVGRMRGEGMLDIDFIPIVYNKEKDELSKLMQCGIVIHATPINTMRRASQADDEATTTSSKTKSVLSEGRWVKISIKENGIHALTPSLLSQMGFKDASRVRLFGYGGHMLPEVLKRENYYDDLEEIPLLKGKDGSLLFWANGVIGWDWSIRSSIAQHHTINPYSTLGYYFVTEGDAPAALTTEEPYTGTAQEIESFTNWVVRDVDEYAWFTGGRRLWEDKDLGASGGRAFSIATPGCANNGQPITLRYAAAHGTEDATKLAATWNDSTLNNLALPSYGQYDYAGSATGMMLLRGAQETNTLRLTAKVSPARLDYIEVTYPRRFAMNGNELYFHLGNNTATSIALDKGAASEVVLMRIGQPGTPATLIAPNDEGKYVIDNAEGDFVFVQPSASFPQPSIVGTVQNQNLHAHQPVDMVIITPASGLFVEQAKRLAEAHRQYDALETHIVRADQLYNEFSSGTPDATAYRLYMKMLYDRALEQGITPPRYLLLFGDAAWDNRMLAQGWHNLSPNDFLLCFESDNSLSDTQCYVMEDYFGLLDDGEGAVLNTDKVDLGIGRFPVRTESEAKVMVDKSIEQMAQRRAGLWNNLNLVLGDDGDNNSHLEYADTLANRLLSQYPEMDTRKLMWDSFKRVTTTTGNTFPELSQLIHNYVQEGVNMVNYIGHGATYLLSHEHVVSLADIAHYTNLNKGLWFTAACDIMPFDGRADNIGEAMMVNPYGAAAFIGTTRTVYANYNSYLNCAFARYIFNIDPETGKPYTVGDALRMAKCDMTESGKTVNKLHYALLGDPALVFGHHKYRVVIDSINNGLSSETPRLMAGGRCTMSGHIENLDGNVADDFNGILTSRILDTEETITCLNQNGEKRPYVYKEHRKVLYAGNDSVKAGQFRLSFVVPKGINYADTRGRAIFYAKDNDKTANGFTNQYVVGGLSNELDGDTIGPNIQMWLDNEAFTDGGFASPAPMLYARISDDSGLNFAAAGVGHGLEVSVDNRADMTFDISDSYTATNSMGGTVAYQLPPLTRGTHTLQLRAWDVIDNATTQRITFRVSGLDDNKPVQAVLSQSEAGISISLVSTLTGTPCNASIHLYDATGHLCVTREASGLPAGQTTTFNIQRAALAGGVYMLSASMSQGVNVYQTETQKIIIRN